VPEQQPVLGSAEKQVEHDILVHIRRYLAPLHRALEYLAMLAAQRLEHPAAPGGVQFRVMLGLGDQRGEQLPGRGGRHCAHPRPQRRQQVLAQRPAVDGRLL
jgi:hypothetical protein